MWVTHPKINVDHSLQILNLAPIILEDIFDEVYKGGYHVGPSGVSTKKSTCQVEADRLTGDQYKVRFMV